jgi:hypothetical protein
LDAPVLQTPHGTLGTIVENEFYQIQLSASNTLTYEYLSGVLPDGIRITSNGLTEGFPKSVDYIAGVPQEVGTDVTSEFVVRAISENGLVADTKLMREKLFIPKVDLKTGINKMLNKFINDKY